MFLLNLHDDAVDVCSYAFTIQNVPIKLKKSRCLHRPFQYLQYKMFLLNLCIFLLYSTMIKRFTIQNVPIK